mmetsp:Transcript_12917/g.40107  ORF Transcript_12917/g.40107 Transcript_12917/m.40107 type:complete len:310 (+) Transcript_12917:221-1150(+)
MVPPREWRRRAMSRLTSSASSAWRCSSSSRALSAAAIAAASSRARCSMSRSSSSSRRLSSARFRSRSSICCRSAAASSSCCRRASRRRSSSNDSRLSKSKSFRSERSSNSDSRSRSGDTCRPLKLFSPRTGELLWARGGPPDDRRPNCGLLADGLGPPPLASSVWTASLMDVIHSGSSASAAGCICGGGWCWLAPAPWDGEIGFHSACGLPGSGTHARPCRRPSWPPPLPPMRSRLAWRSRSRSARLRASFSLICCSKARARASFDCLASSTCRRACRLRRSGLASMGGWGDGAPCWCALAFGDDHSAP